MHPMAGQGLNLGMGDIALLSNLIKESIDPVWMLVVPDFF
jgi:2-polyprenyl-6-methoxyphenol hydroxylase-like FAD-dependent oxidoreductase